VCKVDVVVKLDVLKLYASWLKYFKLHTSEEPVFLLKGKMMKGKESKRKEGK
jgi:hypothetical protein